ncbi:electron transport complex subunit E [Clostridium sp. HMP27]|uniref:electron transport complex subunit RsxE n=1 Tax=Clostridium sp. HMP27 TaxID=1487921 RepID=UPI00052BB6DB|nr:electron transport complex subunit E [Clostridium sp. HMP27]KGK87493.1 electron transporter RsxE [Clostridium sp. HMP27]
MSMIGDRLSNGIIKENATFVQVLGMCPTLAVTSSAMNGLGMGLSATVVLIASNVFISALRKVIPDKIRIPCYITVIATLVTVLQFLLQAYVPALNKSLGIFIPLIVVNCIILGRAEAYASKNGVVSSAFDGLGQGLGFTISLTVLGIIRELLGTGKVFNAQVMPGFYQPALIMILAPGAFITLGILMALLNNRKLKKAKAK